MVKSTVMGTSHGSVGRGPCLLSVRVQTTRVLRSLREVLESSKFSLSSFHLLINIRDHFFLRSKFSIPKVSVFAKIRVKQKPKPQEKLAKNLCVESSFLFLSTRSTGRGRDFSKNVFLSLLSPFMVFSVCQKVHGMIVWGLDLKEGVLLAMFETTVDGKFQSL